MDQPAELVVKMQAVMIAESEKLNRETGSKSGTGNKRT